MPTIASAGLHALIRAVCLAAGARVSRSFVSFDEVLVPGEPERRCRAERLANGIEIDEHTWSEILTAADTLGIAPPQVDALLG
jgi:uncharacterized oxidoreductase